jgi:hypothetical protein
MAGYREVLAVERDPHAVATLTHNYPEVPIFAGDITLLSIEEALSLAGLKRGELDVLDGSPPCQGFSTVGKRQLHDVRNGLWQEYVRLLDGLQPRCFVLENVPGLVRGKMRLVFAACFRALQACGYQVTARVLNAAYFGVPQDRHRPSCSECATISASAPRILEPAPGRSRCRSRWMPHNWCGRSEETTWIRSSGRRRPVPSATVSCGTGCPAVAKRPLS